MKITTPEIDEYILTIYKGTAWAKVAEMVNKKFGTNYTYHQMKTYANNRYLCNGLKSHGCSFRLMTPEQEQLFKDNNYGKTEREMQQWCKEVLGKDFTLTQIKGIRGRFHLDSGLTGYFPKGHVPANKGKKMPPEVYQAARATMFRSGNIPANRSKIGTKRFVGGYWEVKMYDCRRNNNWVLLHHLIYEQATGHKIDSKTERLIFLDGNSSNLELSNLKLITTSEHVTLNKTYSDPKNSEVRLAQLAVVKLNKKLCEVAKK